MNGIRFFLRAMKPFLLLHSMQAARDAAGGIPVNCLLSSASLHDSQVAIPLAEKTNDRVCSLYDLMDSAYDAPSIHEHSRSMGHVPIIDVNPRRNTELKQAIILGNKASSHANFQTPESI